MYAVIETGGKQYRVKEGDVITVEKLGIEAGEKVKFENVLVMGEGSDIQIGTPYLDSAVFGEVVENGKGDKVVIYKYKSKKDSRTKQGHRQPFTKVEITGIGEDKPKAAAAEPAEEAPKAEAAEEAAGTESGGVSMSMKKDELIAYAEEHNIEINKSATKQEIIDKINESK
jgi:large subunit ribosomal protein L21